MRAGEEAGAGNQRVWVGGAGAALFRARRRSSAQSAGATAASEAAVACAADDYYRVANKVLTARMNNVPGYSEDDFNNALQAAKKAAEFYESDGLFVEAKIAWDLIAAVAPDASIRADAQAESGRLLVAASAHKPKSPGC